MYGTFVLLDEAGKITSGERVHVGDLPNKNEAWLRDTLFDHPEIIPVNEIDATFAPLVPICKELRTEAGAIDALFLNGLGRLTILECKLWRNPEARREVVAETLHYVSALSNWTYADLQRQVSAAAGRKGNISFDQVRKHMNGRLKEQEFVDAVSRSLREGRVLVLIAGDGIREGVQSLTELVNRNATKAFTFGLIETALYRFGKDRLAIQPRILARTEVITRQMSVVTAIGQTQPIHLDEDLPKNPGAGEVPFRGKGHLKAWWEPILKMNFDDPEQDVPSWLGTNNVALSTPFPGIQIKAFAIVDGSEMGVYMTGTRMENLDTIEKFVRRDRQYLSESLPKGTIVDPKAGWPIVLRNTVPMSADDRHAWLRKTLNGFVNVLRPRLRQWYAEVAAEN